MSHILILGGDGYLGWPTAMYFSARGYKVTVVDNYFRRNACTELDVGMLYPIPSLQERAKIWHEKTGRNIKVVISDLTDAKVIRSLLPGTLNTALPMISTLAVSRRQLFTMLNNPLPPIPFLITNTPISPCKTICSLPTT